MELVALSPVYLDSLTWRQDPRSWMLTVVAKATLDLLPGEMRLSTQLEKIHHQDQRWEDDGEKSIFAPSDMVPFKPRVDVTLVGHAYVPRGNRTRSLVARLITGAVDKSISVFGDRQASNRNEPAAFSRMSLRYERAAGGPGSPNPVGTPGNQERLPNLEHKRPPDDANTPAGFGPIPEDWPLRQAHLSEHAVFSPDEPLDDGIDPAFFNHAPPDQQLAALRPDQQVCLENLHPEHARLLTRLPGLKPQAFIERPHAAPQDLELVPDSLWIDTDRARCTVTFRAQIPLSHREEAGRILVALVGNRQKLSWEDIKRLDQAMSGEPTSGAPSAPPQPPPPQPPPQPRARTLPKINVDLEEEDPQGMTVAMRASEAGVGGGLPFAQPGPGAQTPLPPPAALPIITPAAGPAMSAAIPPLPAIPGGARLDDGKRAPTMPPPRPGGPPPLPTRARSATRVGGMEAPRVAPEPAPPIKSVFDTNESTSTDLQIGDPSMPYDAAPAWLTPSMRGQAFGPPVAAPMGPPVAPPQGPPPSTSLPIAMPAAGPPVAAPMGPPPAAATMTSPPVALPVAAPIPGPPIVAPIAPVVTSLPPMAAPLNLGTAPTLESIVAMVPPQITSAAPAVVEARSPWATPGPAAAPMIAPAPAPLPIADPVTPTNTVATSIPAARPSRDFAGSDIIDLLWFDAAAMPRMRARFPAIIDELDFEELDPMHDLPVDDPAASRDRHHAFGVLTRADGTDGYGITRAMMEAVGGRGRFTAPIVVLAGELRFPFDEVEMLKAATAAAKPLAKDDKKLGDLLESLTEILGTPLVQGASGMIDGLMKELQAAVQQAKRALPIKYLDTHIERVLLEQRKYQKRQVFGGPSIRALFVPGRDGTPIPTYLPESLADRLPLVNQMKVRILAEANPTQDQYESHPQALRVVVLGRVMGLEGFRR